MIITCAFCDEDAFNTETGVCRHCLRRGTTRTDLSLAEVLDGMLHNARLQLDGLGVEEFQQICGSFSDSLFTADEAKAAHQHFRANGVLCEHVVITWHRSVTHSLILSRTERGMQRALAAARKAAKQALVQLDIIPLHDA